MASTKKQHVQQLLAMAVAACEDKKAEDIRVFALDPAESGLTDYFLICNGNNDRQNVAITDEIEIRLKRDFGTYPTSVEGRRQGDWILMDYVDFIVHVFSPEKRAFYNLERLRKTATVLSIADLNAAIKESIASTRAKASTSVAKKTAVAKKTTVTKKATVAKKSTSSKSSRAQSDGLKKAASKKTASKKVTTKRATVKKAKPGRPKSSVPRES
ncbi:MAG: ribosome silencing factor [Acidobacteria bacterium]|nr:ribosome silencing factor [Acidobacteriota bacterium]